MYDYQKSAEAVLIRRAKRGDVKAFSELYSRIYVELYKFALYTLKHPQEAEDAVSDTVVTAYEKISSLKKEESFRSWIFTILSNHCKNQFRKRAQTHELDETYPSKESDYADCTILSFISSSVKCLSLLFSILIPPLPEEPLASSPELSFFWNEP